jgi:hypothetical protein
MLQHDGWLIISSGDASNHSSIKKRTIIEPVTFKATTISFVRKKICPTRKMSNSKSPKTDVASQTRFEDQVKTFFFVLVDEQTK